MRYPNGLASLCLPLLLGLGACDRLADTKACPKAEATEAAKECPKCPKQGKAAPGGPPLAEDKGDIKLTFADPKRKDLGRFKTQLEKGNRFGRVVDGLNETMALPRDAAVLLMECGRIDAFYDLKAPGVVICYELAEHFEKLFTGTLKGAELEQAVTGAVFFAFLHELGHALVHQLELPVTGKEEDAVDQLASVVLIESGSGIEMALDGGRAFLLHAKSGFSDSKFWDEHSFEEQRYYAIMCMAYGAAPNKRDALVGGKGRLPKARAATCPSEYKRILKAWTTILAPHGKAD